MIYIYDIILNWSKDKLYNFFEWEKTDKITHIKKIPIIKIEKGLINNFLYNEVKIDEMFLSKIYNLTEAYSQRKQEKIQYACLLCDTNTVLAILTDKYGNVKYRSKLLIDEEEEILCISQKINKTQFKIEVGKEIDTVDYLTRSERKIKFYLKNTIEECYKLKKQEKLKYLYTEFFGTHSNNLDDMYNRLMFSLNNMDNRHINLYKMLQLISNKN